MKQTIFAIYILLCSLISSAQFKVTSVDSSSKRYIYEVSHEKLENKYYTVAYMHNSVYYNRKITHVNECELEGGLLRIKKEIVEVLKKRVPYLAEKALKVDFKMSIFLLPRYDGRIEEIWFFWNGTDRFFKEDEMDLLINDLQKIRVVFRGSRYYDTPYCQTLNFGISPEDWEYILNSTKGK